MSRRRVATLAGALLVIITSPTITACGLSQPAASRAMRSIQIPSMSGPPSTPQPLLTPWWTSPGTSNASSQTPIYGAASSSAFRSGSSGAGSEPRSGTSGGSSGNSTPTPTPTPPVALGPARLQVSAQSTVTAVNVPSNGAEWDICVPATLTIANNGNGQITTVTVVPTIDVTSPGGQTDRLWERPSDAVTIAVSLRAGSPTTRSVQACGELINNADQTIRYVGTGHLVGGNVTGTATGASSVLPTTIAMI